MTPLQTFSDHLQELRKRILWVVLAIGSSAGVSYVLRTRVIKALQRPLGAPLFYTSPMGSFNFVLKLSTIIGIFIALPVITYQLLRFIEPALPVKLKRGSIIKIIGSSFVLALIGIAFGFFVMIPMSLHFFAGFSSAQIKPLITTGEYLSYVMNMLLTFALAFQIPLIVLFVNWIKPLQPKKLLHYQRHVIVGAFAIAVILPFTYDPISQFILAVPIVGLFYFSIVLVVFANRHQPKVVAHPQLETPRPTQTIARPLPARPASAPARRIVGVDGIMRPAA